jgi:hypothetical protein
MNVASIYQAFSKVSPAVAEDFLEQCELSGVDVSRLRVASDRVGVRCVNPHRARTEQGSVR